ncbi:MAG: flagellar motor protein MotB [Aliidongia sp.]
MAADLTPTNAAGRKLGAISTLVSLFLLLLVFFIVLLSISQVHRQRLDAVIVSLDDAFGRLPSGLGLLTRPIPSDNDATPEGFARAVGALITDFTPLTETPRRVSGDVFLEIDLAPEQVFRTGDSTLQPEAIAILDRLAVLLQRHVAGQHYRLTVRETVPSGFDQTLAGERVAGLAAALFAKGCPADALAIATESGPGAALRLDFALVGTATEAD